jgi:hypothetical protein
LGAQALPKHSQATWKKASPKPNSQAQNPKNNQNQKCNPKHKQKNRLGTQKHLQQQPNKEIYNRHWHFEIVRCRLLLAFNKIRLIAGC